MSRPLTPLMLQILAAMKPRQFDDGMTGNEIGLAVGEQWGNVRRGGSRWSGGMGPAQRIIFPLSALYRRGLVAPAERRDGLTGTAYRITQAGVDALDAES